jgi:hypothetical protein
VADALLDRDCASPIVYTRRSNMSDSEQRKSKAISELFSGPPPIVHFKIPSVICALPPWASTSEGKELAGDLFFTDKGIIFVQLADLKPPSETGGRLFGAIGGLITGSVHVARRKKALSEARAQIPEASDLRQTIEEGGDALFIPRGTISRIRYTWAFGFQVNTAGEWQQFLLERGKKTYHEYQSQIEKYLAT